MPSSEPAVLVIGVDHHRTPVAIRERLAIGVESLAGFTAALLALPGCTEALVVSTCNRLEMYMGGAVRDEAALTLLAERQGMTLTTLRAHSYAHHGPAAVRHLFRVVSGIESLVIGEDQILHQVRQAYDWARAQRLCGPLLHPLFQRAFALAKDVRASTGINKHKLSVASVAVDLARQIHGELAPARLLVIGAGEVAELAVRYFLDHGVRHVALVNRSTDRALAIAGHAHVSGAVKVYPWAELGTALSQHDIVVSSTAAPHAVVTVDDVRAVMRQRPGRGALLFIDLAVPRDIDPAVAELNDVYLYNVDHLEQVVAANRGLRADEVAAAADLVETATIAFLHERRTDHGELFTAVGRWFADVVAAEEERIVKKLSLTDVAAATEVRYGLERVANKLSHRVLAYLRDHPDDPEVALHVRRMLGLDRDAD